MCSDERIFHQNPCGGIQAGDKAQLIYVSNHSFMGSPLSRWAGQTAAAHQTKLPGAVKTINPIRHTSTATQHTNPTNFRIVQDQEVAAGQGY